jgi:Ca-activated chloride channel family protein
MTSGGGMLASFHFLRPQWLWALIPVALIVLLLWRQQSATARWRSLIAPHLLEHLVVRPKGGSRLRPAHLLGLVLILAVLALAGPSWRREPPPFTQDTAPLVIAMDLSRSMGVEDIQPSRLERAQQKARDLLAERKGARTGLLAYAGTTHLVLPLTDDPSVLEAYVTALDPSVMPVPGKDTVAALKLAQEMLADDPTPGTILFLTDGIAADAVPALAELSRESRDQIAVLAVGTAEGGPIPLAGGRLGEISALDRQGLDELERATDAYVTTVTVDDTDVRRVSRRIASHLTAVQQESAEGRWRDEGWWLVIPLLVLALGWFRQGWTVQWEA